MSKIAINILLILSALLIIWYFFKPDVDKDFDSKKYETKIDSLQIKIDSLNKENKVLDTYIISVEEENKTLVQNIDQQNKKINGLKKELKKSKEALSYTPTQIDSFFINTYTENYKTYSKDTTHLPIEVSKAAIVDIKDSKINSELVIKQDSLIKDLNTLVSNKDTIISTLKLKDLNNFSIINKKNQQIDVYKIEVGELKENLEKNKKKIKFLKIQRIALAIGVASILIIK